MKTTANTSLVVGPVKPLIRYLPTGEKIEVSPESQLEALRKSGERIVPYKGNTIRGGEVRPLKRVRN